MKLSSRLVRGRFAVALGVLGLSAALSQADCPTLNFDNLAVGTAVTNQYSGVTFSVVPQTCSGIPTLYMRVYAPPNGTSSGTRCIKIDTGCPDFSDDYLRVVFDRAQDEVSFTVGDWATTYTIRSYSTVSGAGLLGSFTVVIPPGSGGDVGVHRRVTVTAAAGNLRRVEVQAATSSFEAIDDLTYDVDSTAPVAEISTPEQLACVCDPSTIRGSAYDPDGPIDRWSLHRKALGATSWTLIRTSTAAVTNGFLATWSTAAGDGYYTLRLTVVNGCGLETVWTTDIYLDRAFNTLGLRVPAAGQIVGGTLCADGTAWDHCSGTIAVERRAASGGVWVPFDTLAPPWVITDQLGSWNTRTVADGDYLVRVRGTDECGNAATQQVAIVLDNSAPAVAITAPVACAAVNGTVEIRGTASDLHLQNWILQYAGAGLHHWTSFATGTVSVVNGHLADWNTASLAPCAYVLRLVVTDQSVLNCNSAQRNQSEYITTVRLVSDPLGRDSDGDGMPDVWETTYRLDPKDPDDASKDADADGQTNLEEYLAGTNPRDPESVLRILALALEDNDVRVSWTTAESRHYQLLAGTNLWSSLAGPIGPLISIPPGGPAKTNYLQRGGAALPERFYRVRLVP